MDIFPGQRLRAYSFSRGTYTEVELVKVEITVALFVYVDNSNVWIEGQRLSAVRKGLAVSPVDAMERKIVDHTWAYDFGRLYELCCPDTAQIGRSILLGSRPPANDSLWGMARRDGFEVEVFDRSFSNKEKEVDVRLATVMVEDSYEYMKTDRGDKAVLVAGDRDYVPTVESLAKRGFPTIVVFWEHATAKNLRTAAADYHGLDPHFDAITRRRPAAGGELAAT